MSSIAVGRQALFQAGPIAARGPASRESLAQSGKVRGKPARHRRAFSLVELLVVLGVIALLLGLLLPAVQRVRESAAVARCQNQLKQLALAAQHFHDAMQTLPHNGGWDGRQTILSRAGVAFTPATQVTRSGQRFRYGVGDARLGPRQQTGSWLFSLLPHLEQGQLQQSRDWSRPVPAFHCASRRAGVTASVARDRWGSYETGDWEWARTDYAGNGQVFLIRPDTTRLADITDGTSSTILAGEKSMRPDDYSSGTWYWDEPYFLGDSGGTVRATNLAGVVGVKILRDANELGELFAHNFGSAHAAGANFALADGSVRLLRYEMSAKLLRKYLSTQSREVIPEE